MSSAVAGCRCRGAGPRWWGPWSPRWWWGSWRSTSSRGRWSASTSTASAGTTCWLRSRSQSTWPGVRIPVAMGQLLGETLLTVQDLQKSFGDRELLKPMSFSIHRGARIGILGSNGCGKYTFLRILAGQDPEHGGSVERASGTSIGYLPQEPLLDPAKTVRECAAEGLADVHRLLEEYQQVSEAVGSEGDQERMDKLLARMDVLQEEIERRAGWEADHQLEVAMEALRVPPGDRPVSEISGGE